MTDAEILRWYDKFVKSLTARNDALEKALKNIKKR